MSTQSIVIIIVSALVFAPVVHNVTGSPEIGLITAVIGYLYAAYTQDD